MTARARLSGTGGRAVPPAPAASHCPPLAVARPPARRPVRCSAERPRTPGKNDCKQRSQSTRNQAAAFLQSELCARLVLDCSLLLSKLCGGTAASGRGEDWLWTHSLCGHVLPACCSRRLGQVEQPADDGPARADRTRNHIVGLQHQPRVSAQRGVK